MSVELQLNQIRYFASELKCNFKAIQVGDDIPNIPKKNAIKATLKSRKEKSILVLTHAPHQRRSAQTKC